MDDSKIFIVGAKGQLGVALRQKYPGAKHADVDELDITSKESVAGFDWSGIEIIINAAAYTNVDGAETPEGRVAAWQVNADAVANLVAAAAQHNATLVHISSDYVFDGTKDEHQEDEPFSPLSVYGASKAAGDLIVSLAPKFYIVRTSWVIGDGKNFVRTMIGLAEKNISPTVVHDQVGRLTFTSELVKAIGHLLAGQLPFGTYNISNAGTPASWADITRKIFEVLNRGDLKVANTTTAEYFADKTGVAPRPLKSTLSLDKIHRSGFISRDWQEDLIEYIGQQGESPSKE
jgi:dTDP-4-dehydrorhamnose reductase